MAKIFISYNRSALAEVEGLAEDLRDLWDHEIWYDQALTGGQRWWDNILTQIRNTDLFLFALTAESLDSEACRQELKYATALGRPILPVRLSEDFDPSLLYSPLNELHVIDCRVRDRATLAVLRRAISGLPAAPPLPDPLPQAPPVPLSYLGNLRERIDATGTLSYPMQAGLVLDIKGYLKGRGANAHREVEQLLRRLQQRPDLLAIVATEINEVLAQLSRSTPAPKVKTSTAYHRETQNKPQQGAEVTVPPPPPQHYRIERVGRKDELVQLAGDPPALFALGEAAAAITKAIARVVLRGETWKIAVDEKNYALISTQKDEGEALVLHAELNVRDNIKDDKQNALKALGWDIGGGQTAKGVGAAAMIYATSGIGALGLLSKSVRDYILACTARKTWPSARDPVTVQQAALELAAALMKIADPDAIVRQEKV